MTIPMKSDGRITVPATARRQLGIDGETQFDVEVTEGALILRPAVVLRLEDAWAYTPQHRKLLKAAHVDSRTGRVRKMTPAQLKKLADS
jgi:AbrB family looped-hinge helix DNA binding protein